MRFKGEQLRSFRINGGGGSDNAESMKDAGYDFSNVNVAGGYTPYSAATHDPAQTAIENNNVSAPAPSSPSEQPNYNYTGMSPEDLDFAGGSTLGPTFAGKVVRGIDSLTNNTAADIASNVPQIGLLKTGLQFIGSLFGLAPQQQWNYPTYEGDQSPQQPGSNNVSERQGTGTDKLSGNGPQRQFDDKNDTSGNQRVQTKQSEVGTTVNTIPVQTAAATADTTTLNPEEAAATAKEEEKKAARQRVGLMQMRAIDPLFMEGLPSIFRSMAR